MAKPHTSKQAKTAAKVDTDAVKKPARTGEREPRRRHPRARSHPVAVQTNIAEVPAAIPKADTEDSAASTTNDVMSTPAPSLSRPVSQGTDAATASGSGADRPPASTKRAMLIERAEGASVAEIGQRLGWLPHTVRAAITGLHHAGREVTRNKDQGGQSLYRVASVETSDR